MNISLENSVEFPAAAEESGVVEVSLRDGR